MTQEQIDLLKQARQIKRRALARGDWRELAAAGLLTKQEMEAAALAEVHTLDIFAPGGPRPRYMRHLETA